MAGRVLPLSTSLACADGNAAREIQALVSGHFHNLGLAARAGGSMDITRPRGAVRKPHLLHASGVLNSRFVPEGMEVLPGSRALQTYPWSNPTLFIKADVDWSTFRHGLVGSPRQLQSKYRHPTGSVRAGLQDGRTDPVPSRQCIVLDIEGTTTPITFVTDVLFPYARDNVRKHLMATYDSEETKEDIKLLRSQIEDDLKDGVMGSVPVPSEDAGREEVIDSLVTNVEAMIQADRKITSLKQLQGHIWRTGFENKELQGIVFEDVPEALHKWHAYGIKVYIYSSGSREAQRLIFGNTTHGDLRKHLCGFFDTMVGNKREPKSYFEISQSLGVDKPSQVLFVTDVYQEAVAAKAAGLEVVISVRPGNAPLPENHGFATINSFAEI